MTGRNTSFILYLLLQLREEREMGCEGECVGNENGDTCR